MPAPTDFEEATRLTKETLEKLTKTDLVKVARELQAGIVSGPDDEDELVRQGRIDAANEVFEEGYEGELTMKMLRKLEPLLREPIAARYIETIPAIEGKPYVSTGVKSAQVLIDRMNEVLGAGHWRALAHYANNGELCRVWVIVGNNLSRASTDKENGNLELTGDDGETAEVLIARDGWGGHRARSAGDTRKGSETNTLKRVLARVGPGCDVYRLDYDADNTGPEQGSERPRAQAQQPRGQRQRQQRQDRRQQQSGEPESDAAKATPEELEEAIAALVLDESASEKERELRKAADAGMKELGAEPSKRLTELEGAKGERGLEALINRISAAGQ